MQVLWTKKSVLKILRGSHKLYKGMHGRAVINAVRSNKNAYNNSAGSVNDVFNT